MTQHSPLSSIRIFLILVKLYDRTAERRALICATNRNKPVRAITCEFCRDLHLAILCSVLSLLFCLKLYKKEMSEC